MNEHAGSGAKERELLYQNTKPSAHTLMEEMGMGSGRDAVNKGNKRRKEKKYCADISSNGNSVKEKRNGRKKKNSKQELKSKREQDLAPCLMRPYKQEKR